MTRKILVFVVISCLLSTIFLTPLLAEIRQGEAASGTVYIMPDGSIQGTTNIQTSDKVTYVFIANISGASIIVERDNIIIDGKGYILQGEGSGTGIDLSERTNVTVKNAQIKNFNDGLNLSNSSRNIISWNSLTGNHHNGILLGHSSSNIISGNNVENNTNGIWVIVSSDNIISGNNVTANDSDGLSLYYSSSGNIISGNNVTGSGRATYMYSSSNNTLLGNALSNFAVWGESVSDFLNDVTVSNTVNGKPIYYWINGQDMTVPTDAGCVVLVNCERITVQNLLNLADKRQGILLVNTTHSTITKNSVSNIKENPVIYLSFASSNNNISDNVLTNNDWGILLDFSSNNIVSGNILTESGGIWVRSFYGSSTNNTVIGNNLMNNSGGISLSPFSNSLLNFCSGNTVSGNILMNNTGGIALEDSSDNIISDNILTNDGRGIMLDSSSGNTVSGNNITNSSSGISLSFSVSSSLNNTVSGNILTNNGDGILLDRSSNNRLTNNTMIGNRVNFGVIGSSFSEFVNYADASNTVDYKPVYYLVNSRHITVPVDAGYVALVNCTGITVRNLLLARNYEGVLLAYTTNSTIAQNNVTGNSGLGIWLISSSSNAISGNSVTNNSEGIWFDSSSTNNIIGNYVENNGDGIGLSSSSGNMIYHNNFVDNNHQVFVDDWSANAWDDGYPSGGNYWSDYETRYPNATETDSSGVWNTPYIIDDNNTDHCPLINPFVLISRALTPYETQGSAGWCWAASTAMVLRFYGKPVHVWDVGKMRWNPPLDVSDLVEIINEMYPGAFETKIGSYSVISEQVRTDIEGNISSGYPVILQVNPGPRHMVVVTDFNSSGFFVNDPSGLLFEKVGGSALPPFIHRFVTWTDLSPYISKGVLGDDVFLVVEGNPSPVDATLSIDNGAGGIRTMHSSDYSKGVDVDYGGWCWYMGLYWNSLGWHGIGWDSSDVLLCPFKIFNQEGYEQSFDFHLQIKGDDGTVYYEKLLNDIVVPAFDVKYTSDTIVLASYLIKGQKYTVTSEISHHGVQGIIDSITLPPVYYGDRWMSFVAECPVRMLVTDTDGLRVGFDKATNQTVQEIPNSMYYYGNDSNPEMISIPDQKTGNYTVTLFGTESGTYNLTCLGLDARGWLTIENITNVSIENNQSQTYTIPEFPSFLVLELFLMATVLAVTIYKKKARLK